MAEANGNPAVTIKVGRRETTNRYWAAIYDDKDEGIALEEGLATPEQATMVALALKHGYLAAYQEFKQGGR